MCNDRVVRWYLTHSCTSFFALSVNPAISGFLAGGLEQNATMRRTGHHTKQRTLLGPKIFLLKFGYEKLRREDRTTR